MKYLNGREVKINDMAAGYYDGQPLCGRVNAFTESESSLAALTTLDAEIVVRTGDFLHFDDVLLHAIVPPA